MSLFVIFAQYPDAQPSESQSKQAGNVHAIKNTKRKTSKPQESCGTGCLSHCDAHLFICPDKFGIASDTSRTTVAQVYTHDGCLGWKIGALKIERLPDFKSQSWRYLARPTSFQTPRSLMSFLRLASERSHRPTNYHHIWRFKHAHASDSTYLEAVGSCRLISQLVAKTFVHASVKSEDGRLEVVQASTGLVQVHGHVLVGQHSGKRLLAATSHTHQNLAWKNPQCRSNRRPLLPRRQHVISDCTHHYSIQPG